MTKEDKKKSFTSLSLDERASIASKRLQDPEKNLTKFADEHNITLLALKKIEEKMNFNKEAAAGAIMKRVLEKDLELLDLSTNIKYKWAESVGNKKRIDNRDVDTLDKIENTAMKRAAILNGTGEDNDN